MPTEKTASTELPSTKAKISSRRLRVTSGSSEDLELATPAKKKKTRKRECRERPSTELPSLTVKTSSRSWSRLSSGSSEMSSHSHEDLTVQSLSKATSGKMSKRRGKERVVEERLFIRELSPAKASSRSWSRVSSGKVVVQSAALAQ